MYTSNNLDNWDKLKLILMLQVRQLRLVTLHPQLPSLLHAHFLHCTVVLENTFELYFIFFVVNNGIPTQLPIKEVWPVQS